MEDTNRHQIRRPPFDVRRTTVLDLVKFHAGSNPRHIFCWQLEDLSRELTLIEITYETFYRMVGFCQSWLKKNLPERVQSHSVESPIALLLDSDVGAMVYLVASIGLGISVSSRHRSGSLSDWIGVSAFGQTQSIYAATPTISQQNRNTDHIISMQRSCGTGHVDF